jgi:CHAT domain-containing protein
MLRVSHLALLAALSVGCSTLPPAGSAPAGSLPGSLGSEAIDSAIAPGEAHRYTLDVGSHRWATIELAQREVALGLTVFDAAGNVIVSAHSTANWSVKTTDLLTGDEGPFEIEVAAPAEVARAGGYRLRLVVERPEQPSDRARLEARRRIRELDASPAEEEEILREMLESAEIAWSEEEAAEIHHLIGRALLKQKRPRDADTIFRAGLDLLAGGEPRAVEAYLRLRLATALASQARIEEAREQYRAAVEAARRSRDVRAIGVTTNYEAIFLLQRDEIEASVASLQRALVDIEPRHQFSAHLNLALGLRLLGDPEAALVHYAEAVRLAREAALDHPMDRHILLRTGGILHHSTGEMELALAAFREALHLAIAEERTDLEMEIGIHLGALLVKLGERLEARRHLERIATLAEQENDADALSRALLSLGWIELEEGEPSATTALLGRALGTGDLRHDLDASIRFALAVAKKRLGEGSEARQILEQLAARAEETGMRVAAAEAQYELGSLHLTEGRLDAAAAALGRAEQLARSVGDPLRRAAVSSRLAELEVERGRPAAALEQIGEALRLQEAARSQLVEPDLRSSFLARWRDDYDLAIDISLRLAASEPGAGHERAAFELSEAAHARTLTELLAEARVDVRHDLSPELQEAERQADRKLTSVQNELTALFRGPAPADRVERLRRELEEARARRDAVEREIRVRHLRYAEIRYPEPPSLEQVQDELPAGTALVEYALGERSSAIFVVTRQDLFALPLPPAREIAERVAEVRRLLREPSPLYRPRLSRALDELTALLITPVAGRLAEVDSLLVVPDRDLFYLPFEALGDPLAPQLGPGGLLRRWTVTYLPSAAVLQHLRRPARSDWQRDLLVFADPPPVTTPPAEALRGGELPEIVAGETLPSLPGARREAMRIAALFPPDRVDLYLGAEALESRLKRTTASARWLHIATHGVIDVVDAAGSYVQLASDSDDDGRLYLDEVFDLELDVELVVLSGCDTALGPRLAGEGLLGLARGFLYAGAQDLVVSLWPVSDTATEELMFNFYRQLQDGRSTADAMRAAKLARLDDGGADTFHWAPFVVFGAPPRVAR